MADVQYPAPPPSRGECPEGPREGRIGGKCPGQLFRGNQIVLGQIDLQPSLLDLDGVTFDETKLDEPISLD